MYVLARGEGEKRGADRPEIGARVDVLRFAERLFGSHEGRRAEERAAVGRFGTSRLEQPGDAEVEHLEPAIAGEKQVGRLDVAVDDAAPVRGVEHVQELDAELAQDGVRQVPPSAHPHVLEVLPLEELHHQERRAVFVHVVVQDGDRARMPDLVRRLPLPQKALADLAVERQLRVQELDGDAAPISVNGRVDRRHSADAEQALETILVAQRGAHALRCAPLDVVFRRCRHGIRLTRKSSIRRALL